MLFPQILFPQILFPRWTGFDYGRMRGRLFGLSVTALCALVFNGHLLASPQPGVKSREEPPPAAVQAPSARALSETFSRMGYRLADIRDGVAAVPRLFLASLPSDLGALRSIGDRKRLFIKSLLPLVLRTNESIWAQRERLFDLMRHRAEGKTLEWSDRAWMRSLAEDYGVDENDLDRLLKRVDIIPPALALAQAAAESGWGTSRFARKGNAVFGQRTWVSGDGLVPARREDGKSHEVRTFQDLPGAVAAYMMNLNRHPAYAAFRARRAEMRDIQGYLDGEVLAGTLIRYAEDGHEYIETLRTIMRVNRLHQLDRARLKKPSAFNRRQPGADS